MSKYYSTLDLYLITSRAEGGPKSILESLASGVPLITSSVGMAPEIITSGKNGFLVEIQNVEQMVERTSSIIENQDMREKFIKHGLETVQDYTWENIVKQRYEKIYKSLI